MRLSVPVLILTLAAGSPAGTAAAADPKLPYGERALYDDMEGGAAPRLAYAFAAADDDAASPGAPVWAASASLVGGGAFEAGADANQLPFAVRSDERAEQRLTGLVSIEAARQAPVPARGPPVDPPASAPTQRPVCVPRRICL